jgi:hypothetical protein
MTDRTQPDSDSTYIIRYALELGLLWIDGDGRNKVREALDALDILEAELEAVGAGGVEPLRKCLHQIEEPASIAASAGSEPVAPSGWREAIGDLHAAIQRFHDLICVDATIKAAVMAADVVSGAATSVRDYPPLPMQFACSGVFPVYSADQMRAYVDADRAARAPADSAAPAGWDELRDTLVAVSAAIAEQDDRAAQKMIGEILAASPAPPAEQQAAPKAAPQQEAQEPGEIPESIERMATGRYKVVPSHESMSHRWAVVAGSGTQQLYLGREVECQNMARKFAGAFLDGAFVAMQSTAPQPAPAPLSEREMFEATWEKAHGKKPVLWETMFAQQKQETPPHCVGRYFYRDEQAAWGAWQARAALAAQGGKDAG